MAEFICLGGDRFINLHHVRSVDVHPDGSLSVDYGHGSQTIQGDEATAFLDWMGSATQNPKPKTTVPDVSGQRLAEATDTLQRAGFRVEVEGDQSGLVTGQEPSGDSEADKRSVVKLTLEVPKEEPSPSVPDQPQATSEQQAEEQPATPTEEYAGRRHRRHQGGE